MEIRNRSETSYDISSGKVVISLEEQKKLQEKGGEIEPNQYKHLTAGKILGKRLVEECKKIGNCSFELHLPENEGSRILIDMCTLNEVLTANKGFSMKLLYYLTFKGIKRSANTQFQDEPWIEVYKITYTKPKGIFSRLFPRK